MWILLGNLLKKTRSVFISLLKHVKIQLLLEPVLTGKTLGCRHSRPLSLGDGVVHNEYNLREHFNIFFSPTECDSTGAQKFLFDRASHKLREAGEPWWFSQQQRAG